MSKPRALVFLAKGFEEIEFVTIVDVLRRANVHVTIVSIEDECGPVAGKTGINVLPDCLAKDISKDDLYDLVSLPGGLPAAEAFASSEIVGEILRCHNDNKKIVAAICASPLAFNTHKINRGKAATIYPALHLRLDGNYKYSSDDVVVADNMVTSRGPGTAMNFSLKLVELVCGKSTKDEVAKGLLFEKS